MKAFETIVIVLFVGVALWLAFANKDSILNNMIGGQPEGPWKSSNYGCSCGR